MKDLETLPRKAELLNVNVSALFRNKALILPMKNMELVLKTTKHFSNQVKWIVILTVRELETHRDT